MIGKITSFLNFFIKESTESPVVSVTERPASFSPKGTAYITVDNNEYYLDAGCQKNEIFVTELTESMGQFLLTKQIFSPFARKLISWLNDLGINSLANLSQYFEITGLHPIFSLDGLRLFTICNKKFILVVVIEHNRSRRKSRGLDHIQAVLKTASEINEKYDGDGSFGSFQSWGDQMERIHIEKGKNSLYCFCLQIL